jgi:hypothetical protein
MELKLMKQITVIARCGEETGKLADPVVLEKLIDRSKIRACAVASHLAFGGWLAI